MGSVPHWNAFVANLEMHGKGRFWDPRLNNAAQFPIAEVWRFETSERHVHKARRRSDHFKLPALQFYLALRMEVLIRRRQIVGINCLAGRPNVTTATLNRCGATLAGICTLRRKSVSMIFSRAGHPICAIEPRSWERYSRIPKSFCHDGRFPALQNVVDHYNSCMNLGLNGSEKTDLIQYLLSLTFGDEEGGKSK